MTGLPENDDELVKRIRREVGFDVMMPSLIDVLKEIPELTRRSEGGQIISDDLNRLPGARDAQPARHLTIEFKAGMLVLQIALDGALTGQVPAGWAGATVAVETLSESTSVEVDDHGLFTTTTAIEGPFRLAATIDGAVSATDWFVR